MVYLSPLSWHPKISTASRGMLRQGRNVMTQNESGIWRRSLFHFWGQPSLKHAIINDISPNQPLGFLKHRIFQGIFHKYTWQTFFGSMALRAVLRKSQCLDRRGNTKANKTAKQGASMHNGSDCSVASPVFATCNPKLLKY